MAEPVTSSQVKHSHRDSIRKSKKPLMEKQRRARINGCLNQLKSLVLQAIKKDSSQYSKLEKADILELTVKHLRGLQRERASGLVTRADPDPAQVASKYRAGFAECANEALRYMASVGEVKDEVRNRLLGHLTVCLRDADPALTSTSTPTLTPLHPAEVIMTQPHVHPLFLPVGVQPYAGSRVLARSSSSSSPAVQFGFPPPSAHASAAGGSLPGPALVPVVPVSAFPLPRLSPPPAAATAAATTTAASPTMASSTSSAFQPVVHSSSGRAVAVFRADSSSCSSPSSSSPPSSSSSSSVPSSVNAISVHSLPHPTGSQSVVTHPASPSSSTTSPMTSALTAPAASAESSPGTSRPVVTSAPASFFSTTSSKLSPRADLPDSASSDSSLPQRGSAPACSAGDDRLWRPW